MYLLPIRHPDEPPPPDDCWRTYTVSGDELGEEGCPFLDELEALDDVFQASFASWLLHFKKLCAAHPRRPLKELIKDEKKLHDVGKVRIKKPGGGVSDVAVWQFTHDRIRVLWCYSGPEHKRIIILGRILIKKQQKIKPADVKAVEPLMQAYVDALHAGTLTIVGE